MSSSSKQIGVGIIGCGKISQAYFRGSKAFKVLNIIACADLDETVAQAKAEENGCQAMTITELLSCPDIQLVINLTIPAAHGTVSLDCLNAGKHVYCEKPLTVDLEEAKAVLELAEKKGLSVGCAPDTFFGTGIQTSREIVDAGQIGKVIGGSAHMLCGGHESWHPNPGFYYLKGGGPVLDMAPYYLTALVNLIGPIKRVSAITSKPREQRIATCEERRGEKLPVEVQTHASGTLEFENGALVSAVFSFDAHAHGHKPIEIYGQEGSLQVPDPNNFGGPVNVYNAQDKDAQWVEAELTRPYSEDMRGIGAADMAQAILNNRPHRASGALAYHVLEVMHAFDKSSESGRTIEIESSVARPAALPTGLTYVELD